MICVQCGIEMPSQHIRKRYCSGKCKARYRKLYGGTLAQGHNCRMCGTRISLKPGQGNKWLCSEDCRRASNAKSVRTFHLRRPEMETLYRARTNQKMPPDSSNRRFYLLNPNAPRACEACGEKRVTEIAHKPGHERLGTRRSKENLKWPEKVWVLCPTCHRLLDRMRYTPEELGLVAPCTY